MRLRSIPADIKISVFFIAVFLLGFIPVLALWLPDILIALKAVEGEKRQAEMKEVAHRGGPHARPAMQARG